MLVKVEGLFVKCSLDVLKYLMVCICFAYNVIIVMFKLRLFWISCVSYWFPEALLVL
jgi:hypothetical protein